MHETTIISKCCKAEVSNYCDAEDTCRTLHMCNRCGFDCEVTKVCMYCLGTGKISIDEEDGEGHTMRGVGEQRCYCQIKEREYETA